MLIPKNSDQRWEHPWLRIERATRTIVAERLTHGPSFARDHALALVIAKRREIERAGWFN